MYVRPNFGTKKALKESVARGEHVEAWQPGPFGDEKPLQEGVRAAEGPWYPDAHSWYAEIEVRDGRVVKVK